MIWLDLRFKCSLVPAVAVQILGSGHHVVTVVVVGTADVQATPGLNVAGAEVVGCHST